MPAASMFCGACISGSIAHRRDATRPRRGSAAVTSMSNDGLLLGKCECGAVRYRVADAFEYALNCHCASCRAATGSAFKPLAGIKREKLEITDGRESVLIVGGGD